MVYELEKRLVFSMLLGLFCCGKGEETSGIDDYSNDIQPAVFVETKNIISVSDPIDPIERMITEHLDASDLDLQDEIRNRPKNTETSAASGNVSAVLGENNSTNSSSEAKNKMKVECSPRAFVENEVPTAQVTNSSVLLKALTPSVKNSTDGDCIVVLFFSSQCVFSARMGPHYNALPRVFPNISFYAVDVQEHSNLHVRFGLVYVPNIMLFHNAKPIARFNETVLNLEQFVKFVNKFTGMEHNGTLNVTSADMTGPVPATLSKRVDFVLVLAWAFTICCFCLGFIKSTACGRIVEFLKNTWHEAEAQHEHEE